MAGKIMDEREKGFEKRFALDQEKEFKAQARRNKILGLWAAQQIGLSGEDAQSYAKSVIVADMEEPGDEDVFRKLRADFNTHKIDCSDERIRKEMEDSLDLARRQIAEEG